MLSYQGTQSDKPWPRAIVLVDMNAFFASVEQLDHPEWRGRALAVTNGKQGTCIITSSYEARSYALKINTQHKPRPCALFNESKDQATQEINLALTPIDGA